MDMRGSHLCAYSPCSFCVLKVDPPPCSESNDWSDYTQYPYGGYLNDLWIYDTGISLFSRGAPILE